MGFRSSRWAIAVTVLLLGACSSREQASPEAASAPSAPSADAAAGGSGNRLRAESLLAYEHTVAVRIDATAMPARLAALRKDCDDARHGDCVVLALEERGGEHPGARVQLRAVPAAIEPLVAVAGEGGEIGTRTTQAEDLAVAVADNAQLQDRLRREHARLLEFQARPDLKIADMLTLSSRLAETESALEAASQSSAQYQRRIRTQLLTIEFGTTGTERSRGEIGEAFRDAGGLVATTVAGLIRFAAVLLPIALCGLLAYAMFRFIRRRRAR